MPPCKLTPSCLGTVPCISGIPPFGWSLVPCLSLMPCKSRFAFTGHSLPMLSSHRTAALSACSWQLSWQYLCQSLCQHMHVICMLSGSSTTRLGQVPHPLRQLPARGLRCWIPQSYWPPFCHPSAALNSLRLAGVGTGRAAGQRHIRQRGAGPQLQDGRAHGRQGWRMRGTVVLCGGFAAPSPQPPPRCFSHHVVSRNSLRLGKRKKKTFKPNHRHP